MVVELTVILKGESNSYKHKFLLYETFTIDAQDPVIQRCVNEAMNNFSPKADEVRIKISMEI